jgi:hypothetical protein
MKSVSAAVKPQVAGDLPKRGRYRDRAPNRRTRALVKRLRS